MTQVYYRSLFEELRETPIVLPETDGYLTLRPYQKAAVEAVLKQWDSGVMSTLVVMATGLGKTVLFTEIMSRHQGSRVLVLAHRAELINQAANHAIRAGLKVGIEMGHQYARREDQVVISSVQSQVAVRRCSACLGDGCDVCDHTGRVRRLTRFNPEEFGLVIVDEGHHATADSYRLILKWYRQNSRCRTLLVTATPKRSDDVGLHNVAESCAFQMDLRESIAEGWLVMPLQRFVQVEDLHLERVGTKMGGDLADGELERVFLGSTPDEELALLHSVARPTIEEAAGRQGIVFASGKAHARKLAAAFNSYARVTAECVVEDTPHDERARIIRRYLNGETQFLCGCGVFTEGFDAPMTSVIAVARPTKSQSLYLQMIGRGTRPVPGLVDQYDTAEARRTAIANSAKPNCIVLDFYGNADRHKLISVADVLAGDDVDELDLKAALQSARKLNRAVDMEELLKRAKAAREAREERIRREQEQRRVRVATTHRADRINYVARDVDLFSGNVWKLLEGYEPPPEYATKKQVYRLVRLGMRMDQAMGLTKRQACQEIDRRMRAESAAPPRRHSPSEYVMPFGKFKGRPLNSIPRHYLVYMCKNVLKPCRVRSIIESYLGQAGQPSR